MNPRLNRSITLMELLIAIVLMTLMVLSFASIDLYSRYHVFTADRRAKVQNEASIVLEHMAKEISKAIGDTIQLPVTIETAGGPNPVWRRIKAWIDSNQNAIRDISDIETAYQWNRGDSRVRYWPDYTGPNEVISNRITDFNISQTDNYVFVQLTACWDPTSTTWSCGTSDNPTVTMRIHIKMPSVSTN